MPVSLPCCMSFLLLPSPQATLLTVWLRAWRGMWSGWRWRRGLPGTRPSVWVAGPWVCRCRPVRGGCRVTDMEAGLARDKAISVGLAVGAGEWAGGTDGRRGGRHPAFRLPCQHFE